MGIKCIGFLKKAIKNNVIADLMMSYAKHFKFERIR